MARLRVTWDVTERHEAIIEVDDALVEGVVDYSLVDVDDSLLAEHEDTDSYQYTPERDVVAVTKAA